MTRVKVCGVTCNEDAQVAVRVGAAAIGMICHANSPRQVQPQAVQEVAAALPPFITLVLLFVNAPAAVIATYRTVAPYAWLQFHGGEETAFCQQHHAPYLRSVQPTTPADVTTAMELHPHARALILDGGHGTGTSFDWELVPARTHRPVPVIVAGGLKPANVAAAIAATDPDAVDVSSGVCVDGDPVRKDPAKLAAFMHAVQTTHA